MTETERLLRQASLEIRELRRANEVLAAQVAVVEVFRAALMGPSRSGGMAPDVCWEIDRHIERLNNEGPKE